MDNSGEVVHLYHFGPFGNIEAAKGTSGNKYRFCGKEQDETGLYYFGARYYDPMVGRFITPDPVIRSTPRALNPYIYCYNNPLKYIDLEGEFAWIPFLLIVGMNALVGYGQTGTWQGALAGALIGAATYGIFAIPGTFLGTGGLQMMGAAFIKGAAADIAGQIIWAKGIEGKEWGEAIRGIRLGEALEAGGIKAISAGIQFYTPGVAEWLKGRHEYIGKVIGGIESGVAWWRELSHRERLGYMGIAVLALSIGEHYRKEGHRGSILEKLYRFFDPASWAEWRPGRGLDIKHVFVSEAISLVFRAGGCPSDVAAAWSIFSFFFVFESVGETGIPWEYQDFYSNQIGAY
jgi:RHS repeat-associated protein